MSARRRVTAHEMREHAAALVKHHAARFGMDSAAAANLVLAIQCLPSLWPEDGWVQVDRVKPHLGNNVFVVPRYDGETREEALSHRDGYGEPVHSIRWEHVSEYRPKHIERDSVTCIAASFEDHDPDIARYGHACAALEAATALSTTPPTPEKPADYEITDDGVMRPLDTWQRDNTGTFLRLMLEATNTVTENEVAGWTDEQVQQADCWAFSTMLSASDNDDIQVPERPSFIPYGDPYAGRNPMTGEPM